VLAPTATPAPEGTRADGAVESPEAALRRQITLLNRGDYGAAWDELHPIHQGIVSREQFVSCNAPNDFQFTLDIIRTVDGLVTVAPLPETPGKVITARLTSQAESVERELFEVLVDGQWRWVLDGAVNAAYADGMCP
jgi:hypothetical protein